MYVWVKKAFGEKWGFMVSWLNWTSKLFWYASFMTFFAVNIAYMIGKPEILNNKYLTVSISVIVFVTLSVLSINGLAKVKVLTGLGAFGSMIPAVILILLAIVSVAFIGIEPASTYTIRDLTPKMNANSFVAISAIIFGYTGGEVVANFVTEIENPRKNYPKAMLEKGFTFPARIISGNPNTRKDYDEGYMIVDNAGKLFHMKQTVGRPYVRHIELEEGFDIKYVFINEFKDKKTIAFIVDKHNKFYVLENKSYQLYYTGIDTFNPTEDAITIFGNMFDWTVTVNTEHNVFYYALDANSYSIIKKKTISIEDNHMGGLTFTSYKDKFVKPRISL